MKMDVRLNQNQKKPVVTLLEKHCVMPRRLRVQGLKPEMQLRQLRRWLRRGPRQEAQHFQNRVWQDRVWRRKNLHQNRLHLHHRHIKRVFEYLNR